MEYQLLQNCRQHYCLAAWQSAVEPATLAPVDLAATRQLQLGRPDAASDSRPLLLNSAVNKRGESSSSAASLTAMSGCLASSAADIIGRYADG